MYTLTYMYFLTTPKFPMTLTFEIVSGRAALVLRLAFLGIKEIESKCQDSRLQYDSKDVLWVSQRFPKHRHTGLILLSALKSVNPQKEVGDLFLKMTYSWKKWCSSDCLVSLISCTFHGLSLTVFSAFMRSRLLCILLPCLLTATSRVSY